MYKRGLQAGLLFTVTGKGTLTIQQLFTLTVTQLNALAVVLDTEYKSSGGKSFIVKKSAKDKTAKLKFDIVLDILNTKLEEQEASQEASDRRAHNAKINGLIAEKQDQELMGKSAAELEALLIK